MPEKPHIAPPRIAVSSGMPVRIRSAGSGVPHAEAAADRHVHFEAGHGGKRELVGDGSRIKLSQVAESGEL